MFPIRLSFRIWLILFAFIVFLAGVVYNAQAASVFSVVSPLPGSLVTGNVISVKFDIPDYLKIVDYKSHSRSAFGQGHIHLWLDQTDLSATSAIQVTSDSYILENVKPGPHQIIAELVTNEHLPLIPKTTAAVSFQTQTPPPVSPPAFSSLILGILLSITLLVVSLFFVSSFTAPAPKLTKSPPASRSRKKSSSK
jgi:hypothetical protein